MLVPAGLDSFALAAGFAEHAPAQADTTLGEHTTQAIARLVVRQRRR